jgi:hypothetical protein
MLYFFALMLRIIIKLIRSFLLLLGFASHLASEFTFLFLASLSQLAWRLKQLGCASNN